MNIQQVKKVVASIEVIKDDNEIAHGVEDALWLTVLVAIAEGADDAQALAIEAIKTKDIKFIRWYARHTQQGRFAPTTGWRGWRPKRQRN